MKATLDPASGKVILELTEDEWLLLPHWSTAWEDMSQLEDAAVRAVLKTAGNPEGYAGP
jgi:hypothetical protein